MMCDDSSSAGFASDSIKFHWGYQSWASCYDSAGDRDTCFSIRYAIDTFQVDSFGNMGVGTIDGNSIANAVNNQVDTLGCVGFATQTRAFYPEWDVGFRVWAEGLTGNYTAAALVMKITVLRRLYQPIKSK